jgi:CRP-like cAMP-binding protein
MQLNEISIPVRQNYPTPHPSEPADHFDVNQFLSSGGIAKSVLVLKPKQTIYLQGSPANAIYYIQSGKVRMTVISEHGREGVIAILGPGAFFGESCLADIPTNSATAAAMIKSTVVRIDKRTMLRVLREERQLSNVFMSFLLSRNLQIEADLLDHLFNSSEQRLARLLLTLARYEKDDKGDVVIPKISQDILAARVGTTRSRVNFFMNKFRKLGLIEYTNGLSDDNAWLKVHSSLINVVLKE